MEIKIDKIGLLDIAGVAVNASATNLRHLAHIVTAVC